MGFMTAAPLSVERPPGHLIVIRWEKSKTKGRRMRAAFSGSNWMRDP
jgi:hypothetical protein